MSLTPGPWTPSETYLDEEGTEMGWLVFVDDGDYPVLPVTEADARLIAAAPDLFAALERVLGWFPVEPNTNLMLDKVAAGVFERDKADARAAIAKAKGES